MVDIVRLKVKAGNGGDGAVSWHHEKFKPKGGPDGGNGGNGGSVYLVADPNLSDLSHLSGVGIVRAEDGGRGGKNNCNGRGAKEVVVKVPIGTIVNGSTYIADLTEERQRVLVAQGGEGGRGNDSFKSATNQRPLEHTPGTPGEERQIKLELKMLADVGIIGLPSSGKTSLLNALTSARGRVGNYPFTTIEPNLGILEADNATLSSRTSVARRSGTQKTKLEQSELLGPRVKPEDDKVGRVVIADIPGLIEGAAEGKGLGDEFLRHVERCQVLVHLVSADNLSNKSNRSYKSNKTNRGYNEAYEVVRKELAAWNPELLKKPEIVVISKVDLMTDRIADGFSAAPPTPLHISTKTGEGLAELVKEITKLLDTTYTTDMTSNARKLATLFRDEKRKTDVTEVPVAGLMNQTPTFNINSLPNKRMVFKRKLGGP